MRRFSVQVTYADGEQDYICHGMSDVPAMFPNRRRAQEMADAFAEGFFEREIQSISVVWSPTSARRPGAA